MNSPNNLNQGGNPPQRKKTPGFLNYILIFFLITFVLNMIGAGLTSSREVQIAYSQFLDLVESGVVEQVQLGSEEIQLQLREGVEPADVAALLASGEAEAGEAQAVAGQLAGSGSLAGSLFSGNPVLVTGRVDDPDLVKVLRENGVGFSQQVVRSSPILSAIASWVIPILIMYLIYYFFLRSMLKRMGGGEGSGMMGGMMGSVGKSKAKVYNVEKNTGVTFANVAGQDEAKESLTEMVDFLHHPEKYRKIGAKQPKGALLVGPPGTGKTLLAKAVAGEAGVPFYHLTGSEFVEMFVGVGASRVRDLFQTATKNAPCIIFIDEIDAIGKKRDSQMGGNDEREQTLNQLLAEMDGFDSSTGIVVLAATNRPETLDMALLRPGRFDRRIIVEKPDLPGRENILKVHAGKVSVGPDVDLHEIALATSGATGADLANIVNEAALRAVKMGRQAVIQEDLMESVEVVIAGKEKKDRVLNPMERRMVAYHEVGHALVSALQKNAQPIQKITIVPRTMGALGYTMNAPEEERYLLTKEELLAQITTLLGGRAAEIVEFGAPTTGASNDIERATEGARKMVTQYGMSDRFGPMGLESTQDRYLDGRSVSTCSQQTSTQVDNEVRLILEECQGAAEKLLRENRDAMDRISAHLLEKENITGEEFMRLLQEDLVA